MVGPGVDIAGDLAAGDRQVGELSPDEPCLILKEYDEQIGNTGMHRVMEVVVIRNDRPTAYTVPLGPAFQFHTPPFEIDGGLVDPVSRRIEIWHTVGELMEIAEEHRAKPPSDRDIEFASKVEGFKDEVGRGMEQAKLRELHRSSFGPKGRVIRP